MKYTRVEWQSLYSGWKHMMKTIDVTTELIGIISLVRRIQMVSLKHTFA